VINVCPSEGVSLFRLLDVDDSGTLDARELVDGLLRLRGNSKALELSLLMRQVRCMDHELCSRLEAIEDYIDGIHDTFEKGQKSVARMQSMNNKMNFGRSSTSSTSRSDHWPERERRGSSTRAFSERSFHDVEHAEHAWGHKSSRQSNELSQSRSAKSSRDLEPAPVQPKRSPKSKHTSGVRKTMNLEKIKSFATSLHNSSVNES